MQLLFMKNKVSSLSPGKGDEPDASGASGDEDKMILITTNYLLTIHSLIIVQYRPSPLEKDKRMRP